jgi:serine/threonine protein kinase/DNA-binding beta-propeller fold protein YncE
MVELAPGSVVAGYRIEAIVGRGGMGVVYRATQLSLERPVALKAIAPELAGDVMFRERFKRESRLAASIEHPNVIPVYEAGEGDGLLYLTMRYIEGTDLRALIEADGALEPARAARLVEQVAAAHRRGLMHRDVKPANVLIDAEDGREHAYLTDFGIARHVAATSGLTQTGSVVGTLDYLAPERIEDASGDSRADVYALGCVLFQVLTGSVPYPRDSEVAKMYAHLNAPVPDARELKPVPDALAELAMGAMAKEPDERIQSASELAERLLEAADTRSAPAAATLPAAPPIPDAPPTVVAAARAPAEPPASKTAPTETAPTEPAPAGLGAFRTETGTKGAPPTAGRGRRRRGGLIAVAVGVTAVLIAVVVVLASGGSDDPSSADPENSGTPDRSSEQQGPAPLNPRPLEPVGLQPGADGVATGAGFVWIANRELDTVTRVNARTRRVEGNPIPVGTEPDSLAAGLGAMWVTNTSDNTVTRLDPGDGTRLGTHMVGAAPEGILIARGSAWIANGGDGTVTRLDSGGNETATAPVGTAPVQLAATTDSVWVTVSKDNKIVELGFEDGQPTGREVPIPGTPRGIAYEPVRGELWVSASAANRLVVVDPDSAQIEDRVDVPENPREVRFGFGAIWVTSATAQRVSAIDPPKRRMIDNIPIQGTTYGLATGEGLVWAASESDGLLLPIRPRGQTP